LDPDEIIDEVLLAGLDDWVMPCQVDYFAGHQRPDATPDQLIERGIRTVERMLRDGLMEVGDVTDDGFRSWDVPSAEAVSRIRSEWKRLDRRLEMGDICWLSNTTLGEEHAERLRAQREL
jgi:hypothetical protein